MYLRVCVHVTVMLTHHVGLSFVPYSGKFRGMAREPSEEIFAVVIFAFQCQETTPTTSFACEIPVRGSFSQFLFSRWLLCPRKTWKFPAIWVQLLYYYNYNLLCSIHTGTPPHTPTHTGSYDERSDCLRRGQEKKNSHLHGHLWRLSGEHHGNSAATLHVLYNNEVYKLISFSIYAWSLY